MARSDKETNYLQFELCLLGFPVNGEPEAGERFFIPVTLPPLQEIIDERLKKYHIARLRFILHYSLVEYAPLFAKNMEDSDLLDFMQKHIPEDELPAGFDKTRRDHLEFVFAQCTLGFTGGNLEAARKCYAVCREYVDSQQARRGKKDAYCRTRIDAVWDTLYGKMSWRDFTTLAAVYSKIGDKETPVLIRRSEIQARQTGNMKQKAMRANGAQPLTLDQIRYTLDRLVKRGWVARYRHKRRNTYYAKRMTSEGIKRWLEDKERKLLLKYSDPSAWMELSPSQRERELKFEQFMASRRRANAV